MGVAMDSWLDIGLESDFSLSNIPFGVFRRSDEPSPRVGTRLGDTVVDLSVLTERGYFDKVADLDKGVFSRSVLNDFISLGSAVTGAVRQQIQRLFQRGSALESDSVTRSAACISVSEVKMGMPVEVGDYTDFYSSQEHATNVGSLFRDPKNALLPNWKHLPVGYHGRSSSLVVSGTPVRRPLGQRKPPDAEKPLFGPSVMMDFELEMAFVVGKPTDLGTRITVDEAHKYMFGMVLFNDWSARDVQAWEYVPLGPFLGKSFASSVSAWVVTMEALAPFRTDAPVQDVPVLPYLKETDRHSFDIELAVGLKPEDEEEKEVCRTNFKRLYWTMSQQLAHHTVNGCNVRVGDMCASGTISGREKESFGSLLELTWKGTQPLVWSSGLERTFLQDGDEVLMRGWCKKEGLRVGFGDVSGKILPAH